jgi:hypothetical protein
MPELFNVVVVLLTALFPNAANLLDVLYITRQAKWVKGWGNWCRLAAYWFTHCRCAG